MEGDGKMGEIRVSFLERQWVKMRTAYIPEHSSRCEMTGVRRLTRADINTNKQEDIHVYRSTFDKGNSGKTAFKSPLPRCHDKQINFLSIIYKIVITTRSRKD